MPPRSAKNAKPSRTAATVSAEEKIARCLGLLLVRNMDQRIEQVAQLRAIGFEVFEVAAMLGMTENHVNVAAHHGRKKLGKKAGKAPRNGPN